MKNILLKRIEMTLCLIIRDKQQLQVYCFGTCFAQMKNIFRLIRFVDLTYLIRLVPEEERCVEKQCIIIKIKIRICVPLPRLF